MAKLYYSLEKYLDLSKFDSLHYKICRGFSKAKHLATLGNLEVSMNNILKSDDYMHLCQTYDIYKKLPPISEIKKESSDLTNDELSLFLKFALGGYDSYQTYFIEPLKDYFPETHDWIENLKTNNIFSSITESYFLTLDAGGIPFEHYHPDSGSMVEFLHIRPKTLRPLYIKDNTTLEKTYIESRAAWWDDRLTHGGDSVMLPTYTLRIDGVFTDEFRKKLLDE